jgi:benzoyl-CoA reductase/2-hydroxyglutaryl-CoA dehydratase subunit BcrC/BadD/HgdB
LLYQLSYLAVSRNVDLYSAPTREVKQNQIWTCNAAAALERGAHYFPPGGSGTVAPMGRPRPKIGFLCAYTPLPLIEAAGFIPFRILPEGSAPERAGELLHDNLCPHVKRVLDRVLADDLPELAGVVFVNSCDAMRRLSEAWGVARPKDRRVLLDLPVAQSDASIDYLASGLSRLAEVLTGWSGAGIHAEEIAASARRYSQIARRLRELEEGVRQGEMMGSGLLVCCHDSVSRPSVESLEILAGLDTPERGAGAQPLLVHLFGNLSANVDLLKLLEGFGAAPVGLDTCTGLRQLHTYAEGPADDWPRRMAADLLRRPACARTVDPLDPGALGPRVAAEAKAEGARGVIAAVMKFCDPYISRMPAIREALRETGIPLLVLEGDGTLRSLEQQRTRIEAFVEMLREGPP